MQPNIFRIHVPKNHVTGGLTSLRDLPHVSVHEEKAQGTVSDIETGVILFTFRHVPESDEAEITRVNIPDTVTNAELGRQLEKQLAVLAGE